MLNTHFTYDMWHVQVILQVYFSFCYFELILRIDTLSTSSEISLKWVPQKPIDNK